MPGHRQPMRQVSGGLGGAERAQVVAGDHSLRELFEPGFGQSATQLGLTDQHDLQQLALVGLEVGQQAQLLQQLDREVLCLVDDQHALAALRMGLQQVAVERVDIGLDRRRSGHGQTEFIAHRLQQFGLAEPGVEDVSHLAARRQLLEETATDGGLARADLARQQHEATSTAHAVEQMRQRLTVALAHVEVTRIGCDRERRLRQTKEWQVHERRIAGPRDQPCLAAPPRPCASSAIALAA